MMPPAQWTAERLESHDEVTRVEVLNPDVMRIHRKRGDTFDVGVMSAPRVDFGVARPVLKANPGVAFVMNIPKESHWTGDAIDAVQSQGTAFGGLAELMAAINQDKPADYVKKEFSFVERGLRQHRAVRSINRLHDRKYEVKRRSHDDLQATLVNEYDLTADHVRTAIDRYGPFSDLLVTNPNGRITSRAREAAESAGAAVHMWRDLLSRLDRL